MAVVDMDCIYISVTSTVSTAQACLAFSCCFRSSQMSKRISLEF